MTSAEREPYLLACDPVLIPLGFTRKKRAQEWKRADVTGDIEWVHLNFGLAVINPSLGVSYGDMDALLPPDLGPWTGVMRMLPPPGGGIYATPETKPSDLVADLAKAVPPALAQLRDRNEVIRQLQKPEAKDWPVAGAMIRKRTLPLMLISAGRLSEAADWLTQLEALPPVNERPGEYSAFVNYLRAKYAL